MKNKMYSIGYGGKTPEELIQRLKEASVSMVVDVRYIPYCGWQPTFSKDNLSKLLKDNYIEYSHERILGNRTKDIKKFMLGQTVKGKLTELYNITKNTGWKITILCSEKDYKKCHRKILSTWLEQEHGMQMIHL